MTSLRIYARLRNRVAITRKTATRARRCKSPCLLFTELEILTMRRSDIIACMAAITAKAIALRRIVSRSNTGMP